MCYATGSVPCSDECRDAGHCLLSTPKTVRICVAGGREFDDYDYLVRCMDSIKYRHGKSEIILVSGECRGADKLGEQYAEEQEWPIDSHPADWQTHKKSAGFIRNEEMAQQADVLVAFWDGASKGTRHMVGCAMKQGLEVHIFRY